MTQPSSVTVPRAGTPPTPLLPRRDEPLGDVGRKIVHDLTWTFRNGFQHALDTLHASVWSDPQAAGWILVKHNSARDVWRARIAGRSYFVKYYARRGWLARLKHAVRGPACLSEWNGGIFAIQTGLPAVRPAGYCETVRYAGRECSVLVTEAIEPATALDDFWLLLQSDPDGMRRRTDSRQLVELLGEMIAKAHQAGFEHLDMHAANILVEPIAPRRYRTAFVDLQSARLGKPLTERAVVRNLAQLNQWFWRHSSTADRVRFLRSYLRWRNEYEGQCAHSRPLSMDLRQLVTALARHADVHADRLWRQRDRRVMREGRYFSRVRLPGGWRGIVYVQSKRRSEESKASGLVLNRAWWKTKLSDPLRWFRETPDCKNSHSAAVTRALLEHDDGAIPVIIKRPRARNWLRRLRNWLLPSRSRRAWRVGHGLLHRDLPAARPLALLERRLGPITLDSLVITEAVPGAVDLEAFVRREHARHSPREWWRLKHRLGQSLVREIRRLSERGFEHRDCKASNLLVTAEPAARLVWIDMDGLRASRPGATSIDLRVLTRLFVSLREAPGVTRSDAVRFLKNYCARFGSDPRQWRGVWRSVSQLASAKIERQAARREWKLKNYGRA
jgi:tRNA A-37 threonylcarbamoyl transferase component Bud32